MDIDTLLNDPNFARDITVNLISEVIGTFILVVIIGSAIAYFSEWRRNRKRRTFMLRFLRQCEVTVARLLELVNVWSRATGGYRNPSVEERDHEIVLWRADYVQESIGTATRVADFSAPVLDIDDLRDQFEILAGLWRIEGELRRLERSVPFDGGRTINKRREAIVAILDQKATQYPEFWNAQIRLMKKWRYHAFAQSAQDPYADELQSSDGLRQIYDEARHRGRRRIGFGSRH